MWKTLASKIVFQNPWIKLFSDDIEFQNGHKGTYAYLSRHDGAHAIVLTPDNQFILLKQFRYPIHAFEWSMPGGKIDEGESPEDSVKREVQEELGISLNRLEKIGEWYALSSLNTEKLYIYVGWSDQTPQSAGLSDESISDVKIVSKEEVISLIDSGEITDPTMIATLEIILRKYL